MARLVCRQQWSVATVDSDGDTQTSRRGDVVVAGEVALVGPGQPVAGGEHPVTFVLPADAAPSAATAVEWAVEAEVDRRMSADAKVRVPLTVLATADRNADHGLDDPTLTGEPPFDVELACRTLRPGDTVAGTIALKPGDDLNVKKLTVDLQRVRVDIEGKGQAKYVTHESPCLLSGNLTVPAGATKDFPFELTLAADAVPTMRGPHTHFTWLVVASVIEGGRLKQRSHSVSTQIHVHNDLIHTPAGKKGGGGR